MGEGIGLGGNFEFGAFDVGVDLRGVEVFVAEHLLKRLEIDAVREHEGCRRVAKLVRRKLRGIQACGEQVLFDQPVDRTAETLMRLPSREPKSARLSDSTI